MTGGAAVASDALRYAGSKYVYGGAPGTGAGRDAGTDCSGFVSMVLGRDLGLPIPGYAAGAYTGSAHGPVVSDYARWKGAVTLPANQAPMAGDLVVWNGPGELGHIGIATSATRMVSALDTESGVIESPIIGYGPPVPMVYRRITNVNGAVARTGPAGGGSAAGIGGALVPLVIVGAYTAGVVLLILGAAALLGMAGAAAVTAIGAKAVSS